MTGPEKRRAERERALKELVTFEAVGAFIKGYEMGQQHEYEIVQEERE